mgnify:CR=1 FL=1
MRKYRPRIYYTEADKALMWDRWRKGDSLEKIAQLFDRSHSSVARILVQTGGIQSPKRTRRSSTIVVRIAIQLHDLCYPRVTVVLPEVAHDPHTPFVRRCDHGAKDLNVGASMALHHFNTVAILHGIKLSTDMARIICWNINRTGLANCPDLTVSDQ